MRLRIKGARVNLFDILSTNLPVLGGNAESVEMHACGRREGAVRGIRDGDSQRVALPCAIGGFSTCLLRYKIVMPVRAV